MSKPQPSVIDGYVRDGLVLCYDGYQPPAGGVWKDLSGSGNDMILDTDATFDAASHVLTILSAQKTKTTTEVLIDPKDGWTIEIVGGFSKKNEVWFQGDTPWPYSPQIFLGTGLYIMLNNAAGYVYASTGGWIMSRDAIDGEMQFSVAASASEINCLNNNSEEWDRRPKVAQTENFEIINCKLMFGPSTIRCLRMYNRKLSASELLQNRLLDAQRFKLTTANIQG